jgi:homoserine kinase
MSLLTGAVTVSVPATSANLGPGYDCLGLALDLRDELTAEVGGSGLVVEVSGEGAGSVPLDDTHLVVRALRAGLAALGEQFPPGLRLSCSNRVPHARGLGSSSAAIVGGLWLAQALVAGGRDQHTLDTWLAHATGIEGHPDNVAPALYGGLVVCGQDDQSVWADRVALDPRIRAVAFVPPTGLATEVARGLLPRAVPHADAAANTGRAALLVAALASGRPESLWRGTEDFLHQDYRRPAMPESLALVDLLRSDGHAAVVSGAGPTVLVLLADDRDLESYRPDGWRCLPLAVAADGAQVVRTGES